MKAILAGVYDTGGSELAISKNKEDLAIQRAEELLPGLTSEFRDICLSARHLLAIHNRASVKQARAALNKIVTKVSSLQADLHDLDSMATALIGGQVIIQFEEIYRAVEKAYLALDNAPTGAKQKFHRDWLAMKIVELMWLNEQEPTLVRDTTDKDQWVGDTTFAELLRLGIGMVEGESPTAIRSHMKRGLELAKKAKQEQEKTG